MSKLKKKTFFIYKLNSYGQIGDGTKLNRYLPVAVSSVILYNKSVYYISVGSLHTCALYNSILICFLISFNDSRVCSGNGN